MANHATPPPDLTPSPADTLRRAAALVRSNPTGHPFYPAVADWLEYVADQGKFATINHRVHAMRVARAYLGESA